MILNIQSINQINPPLNHKKRDLMSQQLCPMTVSADEGDVWCNPSPTIVTSMDEKIFGKDVNKQYESMRINTIYWLFHKEYYQKLSSCKNMCNMLNFCKITHVTLNSKHHYHISALRKKLLYLFIIYFPAREYSLHGDDTVTTKQFNYCDMTIHVILVM